MVMGANQRTSCHGLSCVISVSSGSSVNPTTKEATQMTSAKIGNVRDGKNERQPPPTMITIGMRTDIQFPRLSYCISNKIEMKNAWNAIVTIANRDIALAYFSTSALDRSGVRTMYPNRVHPTMLGIANTAKPSQPYRCRTRTGKNIPMHQVQLHARYSPQQTVLNNVTFWYGLFDVPPAP